MRTAGIGSTGTRKFVPITPKPITTKLTAEQTPQTPSTLPATQQRKPSSVFNNPKTVPSSSPSLLPSAYAETPKATQSIVVPTPTVSTPTVSPTVPEISTPEPKTELVKRGSVFSNIEPKPYDPNNQFGNFFMGMRNQLGDYEGFVNWDRENQSILNRSIDLAFQGEFGRAGELIANNPARFLGNLAVEVPLNFIPVGSALKVVKAGKVLGQIDNSPLGRQKLKVINQFIELKNKAPKVWGKGFDDTIASISNAKNLNEVNKVIDDFKNFGPVANTPSPSPSIATKIADKTTDVITKARGRNIKPARGVTPNKLIVDDPTYADASDILGWFHTTPEKKGTTFLNTAGYDFNQFVQIDKFGNIIDDDLIKQVGSTFSEEAIHLTLLKIAGSKASLPWDNPKIFINVYDKVGDKVYTGFKRTSNATQKYRSGLLSVEETMKNNYLNKLADLPSSQTEDAMRLARKLKNAKTEEELLPIINEVNKLRPKDQYDVTKAIAKGMPDDFITGVPYSARGRVRISKTKKINTNQSTDSTGFDSSAAYRMDFNDAETRKINELVGKEIKGEQSVGPFGPDEYTFKVRDNTDKTKKSFKEWTFTTGQSFATNKPVQETMPDWMIMGTSDYPAYPIIVSAEEMAVSQTGRPKRPVSKVKQSIENALYVGDSVLQKDDNTRKQMWNLNYLEGRTSISYPQTVPANYLDAYTGFFTKIDPAPKQPVGTYGYFNRPQPKPPKTIKATKTTLPKTAKPSKRTNKPKTSKSKTKPNTFDIFDGFF